MPLDAHSDAKAQKPFAGSLQLASNTSWPVIGFTRVMDPNAAVCTRPTNVMYRKTTKETVNRSRKLCRVMEAARKHDSHAQCPSMCMQQVPVPKRACQSRSQLNKTSLDKLKQITRERRAPEVLTLPNDVCDEFAVHCSQERHGQRCTDKPKLYPDNTREVIVGKHAEPGGPCCNAQTSTNRGPCYAQHTSLQEHVEVEVYGIGTI